VSSRRIAALDECERARAALALMWATGPGRQDPNEAMALIEQAIADVTGRERELELRLEATRYAVIFMTNALLQKALDAPERFADRQGRTAGECELLPHVAIHRFLCGRSAAEVAEPLERAVADAELVAAIGPDSAGCSSCSGSYSRLIGSTWRAAPRRSRSRRPSAGVRHGVRVARMDCPARGGRGRGGGRCTRGVRGAFRRGHVAARVLRVVPGRGAAEAIAAWLLGIGGSAAYISLQGDRADMPGAALSYIVLGAIWIGGAIFAGDAFHNGLDAVLYLLFAASVIVVGAAGATVSYREGRYLPLTGESA
jgi:hypothetical protein